MHLVQGGGFEPRDLLVYTIGIRRKLNIRVEESNESSSEYSECSTRKLLL